MKPAQPQPGSEWIVGGGEMGQLIRAMDWSATPLGPIASWPQSLRTTVNLCLASDLPICLIWGAGLAQIYNDGYRVICGGKHPRSMGQNFQECWREAWPVIGAAHDSARAGDTAFLEDQHIFLERHGYVEETFFTFSFSPIRDETGRLAGLFHPVIETTPKMLGERRTRTLRDLASRTSKAKSIEEALALTTETLAEYPLDLPFLLIYRLEEKEQQARLVAAMGLASGAKGAPAVAALNAQGHATWPLGDLFRSGKAMTVDDVAARFGNLSAGPFPESIASAVLLPVTPPGAERPVKVVIAGISPRLKPDERLRGFHDLLAGAISTAVANARAYEQERRRAEALAEIDRAKTAFFSNVSHEFRTPLTLLLGPTEDLLALPPGALPPEARAQLDVVHRNSLRLQKLVNSLLDFARLEAGRIQASYEPVNLAALTGDLASVFRSAIEKAGLKFIVDCPPLPEPVHVDREMWEKIVLNLLSNAFKFTLAGEIEVAQKARAGSVQLSVRDTGTGIAAEELPRVFERFHRVAGAVSRTHEGTGIGLALVQELMKLHGGTVRVESELGKGSVFTVTLPLGTAHLPPGRLGAGRTLPSPATGATPFVEEASRWLPEEPSAPEVAAAAPRAVTGAGPGEGAPRIVLADDNADMRDYVRRLLAPQFHVVTAPDGQAALELIAQHLPDLVITDVMMPRLDGFGLVQRLRADPATRALPVIMLSARAGEEARVEGLQSGADDYLIKPFSARELLARVESQLKLVAMRRETEEKMREINAQLEQRVTELQQARRAALNLMQDAVRTSAAMRESEERFRAMADNIAQLAWTCDQLGDVTWYNQRWLDYTGLTFGEMKDWGWKQVHHPDHIGRVVASVTLARETGELWEDTFPLRGKDGQYRWFLSRAFPIRDAAGKVRRWFGTNTDITELRETEEALRSSTAQLSLIADTAPVLIAHCDRGHRFKFVNEPYAARFGLRREEVNGRRLADVLGEAAYGNIRPHVERVLGGEAVEFEIPIPYEKLGTHWMHCAYAPERGANGEVTGFVAAITDVTARRRTEDALHEGTRRLDLLAQTGQELILGGVDSREMMQSVLERVGANLGAELAFTFLAGAEPETLRLAATVGVTDEQRGFFATIRLGEYPCGLVAARRERLVVEQLQECGSPQAAALCAAGVRSYAGFPLLAQGRLLGTMAFASRTRDRFRPEELQLIQTVSDQVAVTLDRAQAAETLRESEERYRVLFDLGPVAIFSCNRDAEIQAYNQRAAELWGREPKIGAGGERHCGSLKLFHADGRPLPHGESPILDVLRTGVIVKDAEVFIERPDGSRIAVSVTFAPLKDEQGEITGAITAFYDITQRKRAEEQVLELNSRLEQRVNARTAELQEKAVELALTSRYKSEFLANMSHELRTPLNSLLILSRTLADNKAGNLTVQQIEWARTIQGSGTDLLKLIDEVLDLSRIEAGKAEIEVSDVPLAGVRDLTERTFRHVAEERRLGFTLTLDPHLPPRLRTDAHRLQQILKNLLANAFKFTRHGGVELTIAPALRGWGPHPERLNRAPRVIAFAVRDTGIGIAPDKQRIIFDAFQQAESGTARKYGGTGLGLAISRDLARLLGGAIRVESKPGTGSTFTLYLPDDATPARPPGQPVLFLPRGAAELPVAPDASDEVLRGRKVLVVDDDARNIFALTSLLEDHEMEVLTATGGRRAIDLIKKTPGLDLVLMDIMMPELDGYETMREIRQSPEFRALPIVALTAKAMTGDREKCLEAGASDYIAKPVDTDRLLSLMRATVKTRTMDEVKSRSPKPRTIDER